MDIAEHFKKHGFSVKNKTVIDIKSDGKCLFTVFPDDEYIQFHDEFTQLGIDLPGMKVFLETTKWDHNHT